MNIRVIANILHTGRLKNKILSPNAWHVLDCHSCSINSYLRFEYWLSIYRGVATNFSEVLTVNQIPNSFPEEDQLKQFPISRSA